MNINRIKNTAKKIKDVSTEVAEKASTISTVTSKTITALKKNSAYSNVKNLNQDVNMFKGIERNVVHQQVFNDEFDEPVKPLKSVVKNSFGITAKDMPRPKLSGPKVDQSDIKRFLIRFPRTAINFLDTSKEIIVLSVWLATVLGVKLPVLNIKTPKLINKVLGNFIVQSVRKLGDRELLELSLTFGSWMLRKKYFESEDDKFQELIDEGYDELHTYEDLSNLQIDTELVTLQKEFFLNKAEQFKLDNGLIFKTLDSELNALDELPISLNYHRNETIDTIDFILSIQNEVLKSEQYLSEFDIEKLIAHYNKNN